jgi:phosphohistidine phosphatase SixA
MKFFKLYLILFICLASSVKADLNKNLIKKLQNGGKLIFIRHAYAPGAGDPKNFNINYCNTQRNLSDTGKKQAKNIGNFFLKNNISIEKIYSSEWCRCKDTALIAFKKFETQKFLNSFFSSKFTHNKDIQMKNFKNFIKNWDRKQNLVFVTHYVIISEILNYASLSGEIIISNKDFKVIDTLKVAY